MNSAAYVDEQIKVLKNSGIPLSEAAWKAALLCVGWPYIFGDRGEYCTPSRRQSVFNSHPDQTSLIDKCQVLNSQKKADCSGCKWYPGGKRVRSFDCRGFTYWVLKSVYDGWELMGVGATSQWNTEKNWKAKGKISDGIPKDTLVCLFVQKGKTMEHTGFGLNSETVECSSGVQYNKTRNKKWTHWGVPACIAGDVPEPTPEPEPDPGTKRPTLRKGDSGTYVTLAQKLLIERGYSCGSAGADGKFGKDTQYAVKKFQQAHGLQVDGVIGPKTWAALENNEPVKHYTVTVKGLTYAQAEALINSYSSATMKEE